MDKQSWIADFEQQLRADHKDGWMGVVSDLPLPEAQMLSALLLRMAYEGLDGLLVALVRNRWLDSDGVDRAIAAVKDGMRVVRGSTVLRAQSVVTDLWHALRVRHQQYLCERFQQDSD